MNNIYFSEGSNPYKPNGDDSFFFSFAYFSFLFVIQNILPKIYCSVKGEPTIKVTYANANYTDIQSDKKIGVPVMDRGVVEQKEHLYTSSV